MNADGWVIIRTDLDTKKFDAKLKEVEGELNQLQEKQKVLQKYNQAKDERKQGSVTAYTKENLEELHKYGLTLDDIGNKDTWTKLASQIETLSNKYIDLSQKAGMKSIEDETKKINLNIDKAVKKVGRWALAVFGVRGAYSAIRRAVSSVSQYNEQIGADINYMSMALASTLEPVVKKIVELAHTLLVYIGYIIKQWTGYDIFKNANKYLQKSVGSAKQLRKELASFDEMNIIGDSDSGSGVTMPSFDLTSNDTSIPKWVKWIADNKELFIQLGGILLTAFSITSIHKTLDNIATLFGAGASVGLIPLLEMLLLIAAPIVIYFAAKGIKSVIKATKELNKSIETNTKASEDSRNSHKKYIDTLLEKLKAQELDDKAIQDNTTLLIQNNEAQERMIKLTGEQETWLTKITGSTKETKQQYENMKSELLENVKAFEELTKTGQVTKEQQDKFYETLYNNIIALDNAKINTQELRDEFERLSGKKFTVGINTGNTLPILEKILSTLDKIFGTKWSTNAQLGIGYGGGSGSGHGFAKGGIIYHKMPALARGGIINMPGRGVPLGNAIGGEKGAEGVIPLTDSQQMELLGEAIGRHITVSATIPVYAYNRQVDRQIKIIQAENNFAANR